MTEYHLLKAEDLGGSTLNKKTWGEALWVRVPCVYLSFGGTRISSESSTFVSEIVSDQSSGISKQKNNVVKYF